MVAPNPKPTVATNLHRQYFSALHKTLQQQYSAECNCPVCKNSIATLGVNENPKFKKVLNAGKKAFKRLHKNGKYSPNDLFEVKEYNELINATKEVFDTAITNQIGDSMRSYLEQDSFVFSGLKTHTQIAEASSYLLDQKGNVQPYYKFEQQVSKLNQRYNNSYLKAEYHFAVGSGQSIERWESFSNDEDRYWLQYRTAGDDKVRDSHAILHNTTLPKSDPFWDSYAVPNGWMCRCTTVEVLARKHQKSNSKKAMKKGEAATTQINKNGKNTLAMFRFNPAKQKKLFPPKNSYMPKHCKSGKLSADTLPVATRYVLSQPQNAIFLSLENDRCKAKKIIEEKAGIQRKTGLEKKRTEYINTLTKATKGKDVIRKVASNKDIKIKYQTKGIKHIAKDILSQNINFKTKDMRNIHKYLKDAEYVTESGLKKKRKDDIDYFYYFKCRTTGVYFNVAETKRKLKSGRVVKDRFLYSITKKIT